MRNLTKVAFLSATLTLSSAYACSEHLKEHHLIHQLMKGPVRDKQFVEENRFYRPGVDLGFDQYKTSSLNKTKTVALTFDDGPHPIRTPKVLDLLKKYNVKATFFILTEKVNSSTMPILKRMIDEGHIIASHGSNHANANSLSSSTYYQDLKESIETIESVIKANKGTQKGVYYRFPYGAYGKADNFHHFNTIKDVGLDVYNENCVNFAFWDIDSADWAPGLSPEQIADNVMAHIIGGTAYTAKVRTTIFGNTRYTTDRYQINSPKGGGVVLLHDIHDRSVEATEIFLKKAQKNNVRIIPIDQVKEFSYQGKNCQL